MIDMLTPAEMLSLDRALVRRTHGRVRVGSTPISVAQAHALWHSTISFVFERAPTPLGRLRHRLSAAKRRREDHAMQRLLRGGAVIAASASLSACATLGGNVKGNFACRAPDGICAPTSVIDDAALALIAGDHGGTTPAGPYTPSNDVGPRSTLAATQPIRTGERVLRIVFPAHIDAAGRFRETSAVHAVVERGGWMTASVAASAGPRGGVVDTSTGLPVQLSSGSPRSLGELAASAPEVRFPDAVAEIDAQVARNDVAEAAGAATTAERPTRHKARAQVRGVRSAMTSTSPQARLLAQPAATTPTSVPPTAVTTNVTTKALASHVPGATQATAPNSSIAYSLPPQGQARAVNPLDAIRAQVADQLRVARPVPGAPAAVPVASTLSSLAGAPKLPAKPVNGPSLFPVSEVNR